MKFIESELKGSFVIEPTPLKDERGLFMRFYCRNDFLQINHKKEFVQFNHSLNVKKGTVRGLHFQKKPYTEIKLIRCISGSVFDVMVDLRKESPTFLKWFGVVLSKDNMKMVYVPEGFAHGFQTLEDNSELQYYHTQFYMPAAEKGINPFDKTIRVHWPLEMSVCSDKDKVLPTIDINFKGI